MITTHLLTAKRPSTHRAVRRLTPLALALACALAGVSAQAQSLQEVFDAAQGYDASFQASKAQLESVSYRVEQSKALNRPSVSASAEAERSTSRSSGTSTLANGTETSSSSNSSGNSVTVGIGARQSLFNRANSTTISQAELSLTASQADFLAAERDLIVRVAQAYFDVLAAQDALETTRTSRAAIAEQLASAKRNFEVGTATITDTREAQARFDLITAQEIAAGNDLQAKQIALNLLVGRDGVAPKPLAVPVVLPPLEPASADAWVNKATAEHPSIERARLALEIATLETEKARAGHLPTLDLSAGVSSGRSSGSKSAGLDSTSRSTSANVGLTLSVPLFAGYSVQNRLKETLKLEDKSRFDLQATQRGVKQATQVAFFGVQSGQAQVKALEAAESSTQLALEATQLGYKVGVRVNLDVLNAQTQLFTTRRDLAKARYDVLLNGLRLKQAAGTLSASDITAVNALLAK